MFKPDTRILIVDHMPTMRKMVEKAFRELGFTNLIEASDGALAWQAIQEGKPPIELVISDWKMPNTTGLDLLKRIRGDTRAKEIPFVMLTAEAEQQKIIEALKAGASSIS